MAARNFGDDEEIRRGMSRGEGGGYKLSVNLRKRERDCTVVEEKLDVRYQGKGKKGD